MGEVIVRLTADHIKVKGGEYVQDLVRCDECVGADECDVLSMFPKIDWCSFGERAVSSAKGVDNEQ